MASNDCATPVSTHINYIDPSVYKLGMKYMIISKRLSGKTTLINYIINLLIKDDNNIMIVFSRVSVPGYNGTLYDKFNIEIIHKLCSDNPSKNIICIIDDSITLLNEPISTLKYNNLTLFVEQQYVIKLEYIYDIYLFGKDNNISNIKKIYEKFINTNKYSFNNFNNIMNLLKLYNFLVIYENDLYKSF
jgi:hypothetical protein